MQAVGHAGADAAGLTQGRQQELPGVEAVPFQLTDPLAAGFPDCAGGQQQAAVCVGLQQVAQIPPIALRWNNVGFIAGRLRRFLKPEADPKRRAGRQGDGPLPFRYLRPQLPQLLPSTVNGSVD